MIWFKNVTWFVWKIRDHLIGQEAFLPTYIAENHRNRSIGKPCEDNLCFFRCLALQNGCHTKNLKRDTVKQPAVKWTKWKIKRSEHTSIQPRTYSEPRGWQRRKYNPTLLCRTHHHYTSSLYLNLYEKHLSCIKDLARYSKSFYGSRCGKYWKRASNLRQHEKGLELWRQSAAQVFRGAYHVPKTVFEELEEECIIVPGTSTPFSLQSHIWFWALLR